MICGLHFVARIPHASMLRRVPNIYGGHERVLWPLLVVVLGSINILWGLAVLVSSDDPARLAPGWMLIGLDIVCWSIFSTVLLVALVCRQSFSRASRITLMPVMTVLACLLIAAFLSEAALGEAGCYVPARIMAGLGAVCFTLFSIVSILRKRHFRAG